MKLALLPLLVLPAIAAFSVGVDAARPSFRGAGFACWHDVSYGPRPDYPDEGTGFRGRVGNWHSATVPRRICRHCSGQRMDVYVPDRADRAHAPVVLFVHGGTWSHCFDKGAIPGALFRAFMSAGCVLVSPNYILQLDNTINVTEGERPEATFAEMLRDIDRAVTRLKEVLPALGVEAAGFVVAGESAGAHLALLYAYDQDNPAHLGLGLAHAMRATRVISIAGPTDIPGMDDAKENPTASFSADDPRRRLRQLVKRLCGFAADAPDDVALPAAARWSPVSAACAASVPTYMVYGQLFPFVKTDGIVPVAQKDALEEKLRRLGVRHESELVMGCDHGRVSTKGAEWVAARAATVAK